MFDYLETMRSNVVGHTRLVLATHVQGHLLAMAMHVRIEDEALGRIVGVMQVISSSFETCMIVDPQTLEILSATQNFPTVFGFSRRDVLARRIKLYDLIPGLKDEEAVHHMSEEIYSQMVRHSPSYHLPYDMILETTHFCFLNPPDLLSPDLFSSLLSPPSLTVLPPWLRLHRPARSHPATLPPALVPHQHAALREFLLLYPLSDRADAERGRRQHL